MEKQNITISLPKDLLREARHIAVEQGSSLSGLIASYIRHLVEDERNREAAARSIDRRLKSGLDLGTQGEIAWTRDDIHER